MTARERAIASMLGGSIGDALGVAQEIFPSCSDLRKIHKKVLDSRRSDLQKDYECGGPWVNRGFVVQAGEWTDDTAMTLCLADSILINKTIRVSDLMLRFVNWWYFGVNSCTGHSIGLGGNIGKAIRSFDVNDPDKILGGNNPDKDAGNGSLMRLAPVPIYWHTNLANALYFSRVQTSTTHNVPEALDGSMLMCFIIWYAINGVNLKTIFDELLPKFPFENEHIRELASRNAAWRTKSKDMIISLPGRCLWSLEAALWCIHNTDTFEDAIVTAINLSGDADTIGAITGQMAGAIYGYNDIPKRWLDGLKHCDKIQARAEALFDKSEFDPDRMNLR